MLPQILADLLMLSQVCCSYSKRPIVIASHFFRNPLLDQWLKGGRCDIWAELINIGFSRPKFNVPFENHG